MGDRRKAKGLALDQGDFPEIPPQYFTVQQIDFGQGGIKGIGIRRCDRQGTDMGRGGPLSGKIQTQGPCCGQNVFCQGLPLNRA